MANIKIRKLRLGLSNGVFVESWIEESHNWPMSTCNNFKRQFPNNVISIDADDAPEQQQRQRKPIEWTKGKTFVPKATIPAAPAMTLESQINAEVAKLGR